MIASNPGALERTRLAAGTAVFWATHDIMNQPADHVILRRAAQEVLRSIPNSSATVLLFEASHMGLMALDAEATRAIGVPTCRWGEEAVKVAFPLLWSLRPASRAVVVPLWQRAQPLQVPCHAGLWHSPILGRQARFF